MRSSPISGSASGAAYLFPLPLDPADIFQVGPPYTARWFLGDVRVPHGVWHWVHTKHLKPYTERLAEQMGLCGYLGAAAALKDDRYTIAGAPDSVPVRNVLPTCVPIDLVMALKGLEKRMTQETDMEVLYWLEFFASNAPVAFGDAIRRTPRLRDLMR